MVAGLAAMLGTALTNPSAAQAQSTDPAQNTTTVQASLQLAVCLNDWDSAIAHARQLEATPGMPIKTQAQLVLFRRQMQVFRQDQTVVTDIPGCEPVLEGFGLPGYTGRPLQVDSALYSSLGIGSPERPPDQILRQYEALWQAGLGVTADTPLEPLSQAQRINTRTGSGVSAGNARRQGNIYAFLGAAGDTAGLRVTVVEQQSGLLGIDDQALLFLFDAAGHLLAEARSTAAGPPQLDAIALPTTGIYYAAVTTPEYRPMLDGNNVITNWQGIGTGAIDYTLTVTGLTPSPQLGTQP
ncbi:MAG: hypothetical protein AAFW95_05885 [Cyanobacteria bacterium J06638_6]